HDETSPGPRNAPGVAWWGFQSNSCSPPGRQTEFTNFVAHRAQADAQHSRGARAIAVGRIQGFFQESALKLAQGQSRLNSPKRRVVVLKAGFGKKFQSHHGTGRK